MKKLLCIFLVLTACSGEIVPEDKNIWVNCIDIRDGETFRFNSNTAKDIVRQINGIAQMTITDDQGEERTVTSASEAWIKCKRESS